MVRYALIALIALASPAFAQHVEVTIRPEKAVFLEGEPIYFVAQAKNVSEYPIGYNDGGTLRLEIPGRLEYSWRQQCRLYPPLISASGVSHPPTFAPGEVKTFRFLLRGYRLQPGRHSVHVFGKAPVRWFQYARPVITRPGEPQPKPIPYTPLDSVEGAAVDQQIPVDVVAASLEELQRVLAPLVVNSREFYDRDLAREGILEAAPPFLTDLIAELGGYQALADINTIESRAHLRRLYDEESDLKVREMIVIALSRVSHPDSLDFLASLLPGRSTKNDDSIRSWAISGLRCIGGPAAAAAIVRGTDWMDRDRRIDLLEKVSPRDAVDAIIQFDAGSDLTELYGACGSLSRLTHYQWCDDDLMASVFTSPPDEKLARPVIAKIQSRWRPWWTRNRNRIRMYGPDEPDTNPSPPKIW